MLYCEILFIDAIIELHQEQSDKDSATEHGDATVPERETARCAD